MEQAIKVLQNASNLKSTYARHLRDLQEMIPKAFAFALRDKYPDLSKNLADFIGRKHWYVPDSLPDDPNKVAQLVEEGLRRVTPKQLAGVDLHHLLPEDGNLAPFFRKAGISAEDLEDFLVAIDKNVHRNNSKEAIANALHSKDLNAWIKHWNANWKSFRDKTPGADKKKIFEHLSEMIRDYGLDY